MDVARFRDDLEQIPDALEVAARAIADGGLRWPLDHVPRRVLMLGMGSSYFAASVVARRLRTHGVDAVAERASVEAAWPPSPDLLVVAISASGSSAETCAAIRRHQGVSRVVALTNTTGSAITDGVDGVVHMFAGEEVGGVACRSFRHTIAALLQLEVQLVGAASAGAPALDVGRSTRAAAAATAELLGRADRWLPAVVEALDSPDGTWVLAPAERLSSALQAALMIREGPRRRADACETADWSHVDVYLTKTLDYRALVFAGSRWDESAAAWMARRGATVVAVGGRFPGAELAVRHPDDDDPVVALLTEVLVAELVAAAWWAERPSA